VSIAEKLERVRERIAAACARAHRPPGSVRVMAVTKTVPAERIRDAAAAGIQLLGENRVQERASKHAALADLKAEWHLIGHLQSNKVARAVHLFHGIDTVDSVALATKLEAACAGENRAWLPVMIEVNIGGEAQKSGIAPAQLTELAEHIRGLSRLRVCGVMTVPPFSPHAEESRRYFAELRALSEGLKTEFALPSEAARWEISMGMSHDFEVAIEEGATLVRIGSAIFGARP
jgi:pyridoxal phosphate enzyme (YggS family)